MSNEIPIKRPEDARLIVRARLQGRPHQVVETAERLTGELVANAISYGVGEPTLVLHVDEAHVRVEVVDAGPARDLAPSPGLALVDALATS